MTVGTDKREVVYVRLLPFGERGDRFGVVALDKPTSAVTVVNSEVEVTHFTN